MPETGLNSETVCNPVEDLAPDDPSQWQPALLSAVQAVVKGKIPPAIDSSLLGDGNFVCLVLLHWFYPLKVYPGFFSLPDSSSVTMRCVY